MLRIGSRVYRNSELGLQRLGVGVVTYIRAGLHRVRWGIGVGFYEKSELIELTFKHYYDACNTERSSKTVI